ncbi:MAG: immune inhibitor A [Ignavibacteriaceae bacterium]|nr:immune inhibitor A [Ignavibacteriaceae bacterium]
MQVIKTIMLMILIVSVLSSQNYKKVKMYLDAQHSVNSLIEAGIAIDHFTYEKDNSIIAFVTDDEFSILKSFGIRNEVIIDNWFEYYANLQTMSSAQINEQIANSKSVYGVSGFHFGSMGGYLTLEEVNAELDTLKNLFPNLITSKVSLGNSIESRPVYMVKISDNPDLDEEEPEVLYTALHHAREPESMMQMIYFMYYLLENYESDPVVKYLVNNRELYFIPVVNPDGYEYNRITYPSGGGMWRKNRKNNGSSYGVDLNRNYGPINYWNAANGGSSTNPASDTYRGIAPFSEPETQIVRDFLASRKIKTALNYHTYSNLLIYPYGALSYETPDSLLFREYAIEMTKYNQYAYGTDMQTVGYATRGNSDDYFYDGDITTNSGKIFAMTPEVGSSSDGFWPAQNRIFPLAQENLHPNLYYAWVAGEYVTLHHPNFTQNYFSPGETVQIFPKFKNKGLSPASNINIELASLDQEAVVVSSSANIDFLEANGIGITSTPVSFAISPSALLESKIELEFKVSKNGVIMSRDTIGIFIGQPEFIFMDTSSNILDNWIVTSSPSTPSWELTSNTFYSAPSCYTDSKSSSYSNNATVTMTLNNTIDLTSYLNPLLTFQTKYEIESNYDYGQVEVSTDNGNNWIALAGKYTNLGIGTFQTNGQPLYDGTQSNWVKEEMSLKNYNSNQVKIRFKLRTDGSDQRDGWYIDDIAIVAYSAIPVELISFTGDVQETNVLLKWTTATELNNYGFEIQRSLTQTLSEGEGLFNWNKIGFVPGVGNSSSIQNYSFVDNTNDKFGKYAYRLKQIDFDGSFKYLNEIELEIFPIIFSLQQNFPNPFNPSTKIKYSIPTAPLNSSPYQGEGNRGRLVTLKVYDILGNEVATLVNQEQPSGSYEVEFPDEEIGNIPSLPSGVYFYQLKTGAFIQTRKMILMR